MDKLRNLMVVAWIVCLLLLGLVAHLANKSIGAQLLEEDQTRPADIGNR